jgi:hypothetical protein
MAGLGRFKLTDALPDQPSPADVSALEKTRHPATTDGIGKGRGKGRGKTAGAKGKGSLSSKLGAEQLAEARESKQAKNAEAGARDRMVEIGRGNQQSGRQRAK